MCNHSSPSASAQHQAVAANTSAAQFQAPVRVFLRVWLDASQSPSSHFFCLDSAVRSSSERRASRFSVSIALVVWFKMLSAARTFVAAGVLGSTMTFPNVETAAVDIWWSRPIDCEYAAHFASRKEAWNSGTCSQRKRVFGAMPTARAASSVFRCTSKAAMASSFFLPNFAPWPVI